MIVTKWKTIFEADAKKEKDPTKLHLGEKIAGGAAIAGGLGAGAFGKSAERGAALTKEMFEKRAKEREDDIQSGMVGRGLTKMFGKGSYLTPEEERSLEAVKAAEKVGREIGNTGLAVAGAVGAWIIGT